MYCRPLEFQVGDHILLKVLPTHGVIRFGKRGKLSPRYIVPFDAIERVGDLANRLVLSLALKGVHNMFYVSQLRGYVGDKSHVFDLTEVEVGKDLSYEERLVEILDRQERNLRNHFIPFILVTWSHIHLRKPHGNRRKQLGRNILIYPSNTFSIYLSSYLYIMCPYLT